MPPTAATPTETEQRALAVVQRSAGARAVAARDGGHVAGDLRDDLDAVAANLRSMPPTPAVLDVLEVVDDERVAVLRLAVERRRTVLLQIRDSISRLRALPTRAAIVEAAPAEACRSCGLARSLLSRIDGTAWVPHVLWTEGPEGEPGDFRSYLEQSRIPLEHMLLETEMVRRGRPALVPDARGDERIHQAIILASGASAYVAAPIVPGRRAVGFLHCDRLGQEQPLTEQDRDNLWTFTEHLAVLLEGVALMERLGAIEDEARRITTDALRDLGALRTTPVTFGEERPGAIAPSDADGSAVNVARLLLALTERERQVLELLSTGASNLEIADALVVSEGTIKTHVNRILRKLRVDNRAQAAARHLQATRSGAAT